MTAAPEWIGYRAEVAVVYGGGAVEIGRVWTFNDERVVVEVEGDVLRFHVATLTMVGTRDASLCIVTDERRRRAARRAAVRSAVRTLKTMMNSDERLRRPDPDLDEALTALIELRDEVTRRIAALSELDN
jgi:hypothetical protein